MYEEISEHTNFTCNWSSQNWITDMTKEDQEVIPTILSLRSMKLKNHRKISIILNLKKGQVTRKLEHIRIDLEVDIVCQSSDSDRYQRSSDLLAKLI